MFIDSLYRVYLVDGNRQETEMTKNIIAQVRPDFQVIGTSTNPQKAIEEILVLRPDFVISELRLKRMSGIGLLEALKAAGADCEFIILSHSWSEEALRDFFHLGGADFLLKSLEPAKIEAALGRLRRKAAGKDNADAGTRAAEVK